MSIHGHGEQSPPLCLQVECRCGLLRENLTRSAFSITYALQMTFDVLAAGRSSAAAQIVGIPGVCGANAAGRPKCCSEISKMNIVEQTTPLTDPFPPT